MRYFLVLTIIVLFISPVSVYSQTRIQGAVSDSNRDPISYATITLLNKADSTIVSYDLTNEEGGYVITTSKKGEFVVRASCMGFKTHDKNIKIQTQNVINTDFNLETNLISLEEVVVKGRRTGVQYTKDTISYNPRIFRDGTENNLGDLLSKLPGIQVDEKGNIRAHGKRVSKVLLNGQDYFGSNTQVATQNLSADITDKIDVLNNYSEYSLLGGFQSREQTVINVDVDKKRYGKLSGEISASGGIEDKYDIKGNLMNMNSKSMSSLLFSQNNTGSEVFNIEDYFRLQGGLGEILKSEGSGKIELSEEEERMLIPSTNVSSLTHGLFAFNYTYQPTDNLKIHSYVLMNQNKEYSADYSKYLYNLPDNYSFRDIEEVNRFNKNQLYSSYLKIDYSISKSFSLLYKGSSSFSDNRLRNQILNQLNDKNIFSLEERSGKP